jgi:hypothetical protein
MLWQLISVGCAFQNTAPTNSDSIAEAVVADACIEYDSFVYMKRFY